MRCLLLLLAITTSLLWGYDAQYYDQPEQYFPCHKCDNHPDSVLQQLEERGGNYGPRTKYEPACGQDNYSGTIASFGPSGTYQTLHADYTSCYTNVYYDGSHRLVRGGTTKTQEDGTCYDSGFSITCFCSGRFCNENRCQNCTTTILPPTQPDTNPTPADPLQCYSCIGCNTVNQDTNVESTEKFASCFIAIELGAAHFVVRGGSPDFIEDGVCRREANGAILCYCSSNMCNNKAADAAVTGLLS